MLAYLERVVPQELDSILMMMPDQNLGLVATLLGGTNHRRERLYSLCVSEFAVCTFHLSVDLMSALKNEVPSDISKIHTA